MRDRTQACGLHLVRSLFFSSMRSAEYQAHHPFSGNVLGCLMVVTTTIYTGWSPPLSISVKTLKRRPSTDEFPSGVYDLIETGKNLGGQAAISVAASGAVRNSPPHNPLYIAL
jgi:hypothetical protein